MLKFELKNLLKINSILLILIGMIQIVYAKQVSEMYLINNETSIQAIGDGLVVLGVLFLILSGQEPHVEKLSGMIATLDLIVVIDGLILVSPHFSEISTINGLILFVTLATLLEFVFFIFNEMVKLGTIYNFEREINEPTELAWTVVSDVGGYYQYANTLSHSFIVSGEQEGMVRQCFDQDNNTWTEVCTNWKEGNSFTMEVNTEAENYPYPFSKLVGDWEVEATEKGTSLIKITFNIRAKYWILGKIMMRLSFKKFAQEAVEVIFDNYHKAIKLTQKGHSSENLLLN